jgi:hypothetical protein
LPAKTACHPTLQTRISTDLDGQKTRVSVGMPFLVMLVWKALLYLLAAVVLAGLIRGLTVAALLTAGFVVGDGSGAKACLRSHRQARSDLPRRQPLGGHRQLAL